MDKRISLLSQKYKWLQSESWYNLPNLISIFRLVGLLPLCWLIIAENNKFIILGAFIVLAICDHLDGRYARLLKCSTHMGKWLDTFGDKIFSITLWIVLMSSKALEPEWIWCICLIMIIDFILGMWRLKSHDDPKPNTWGKIKMVVQFVALGAVIIDPISIFSSYQYWQMFTTLAITGSLGLGVMSLGGRLGLID